MNVDRQMLEADSAARREALDVTRSFIVQAPAGSGKTELLIQRYLHLLAIVDHPEEILAITFTRKAAAEMQLRVLEALNDARLGVQPEEAHKQLTLGAARRVLERDAALGWRIIENPRRMRVQTMDALNGSIARMRPVTAPGGASTANIAESAEAYELYRQAAARTLDWLSEAGPEAGATAAVLRHVDASTSRYVAQLARMLTTRDQWLPFVSSGLVSDLDAAALRQRFERNLERIVTEELTRLRASLPDDVLAEVLPLANYAVRQLSDAGLADHPIAAFGTLPELPPCDGDGLPRWRALAELLLTGTGSARKTIDKRQGFPTGDDGQKGQMLALLEALAADERLCSQLHAVRGLPPVRYSDEQWQVLLALFRLLPLAVGELRQLFQMHGVTDHIEVAIGASTALGSAASPGDIALLLDYQVRHILVDEMQDTSRAQYRMLDTLTGGWEPGDGRTLFCVGDPMQSIYRFRNAEVAQFLLARERGIGNLRLESLVLRRNFRSGERLVEWFNEVFDTVLPAENNALAGAVSYSPAVAVEAHAGQGEIHCHPVLGSAVAAEAASAATLIQTLLAEHPGDNVAVLVRGRTQLPPLLARLRRAGVAYQAVDIDRLTDLPELIDLQALTRALSHRGDRLAWLALLRGPWFGLDWTDLHALVTGAPRASIWELLRDPLRCGELSAAGQEIAARAVDVLAPLLSADRSVGLAERVERAWFRLGGPALLDEPHEVDNVYYFFDALEKLDRGGTLEDVAQLADALDEDRVSTSVTARVQVMTMHKAKGLQFDHVVLYGLGRSPGNSAKPVLNWLDLPDSHGDEEKVLSPIGRDDQIEKDPLHQFIDASARAKDRYELGRLLYVACTRAVRSLHLVAHVGVNKTGDKLAVPKKTTLLSLLWPVVGEVWEQAFAEGAPAAAEADEEILIEPELRRLRDPWRMPEVADLPGAARTESGDPDAVDYYWVGADARIAGTIVHRWLQYAAEGRCSLADAASDALTAERWARELGAIDPAFVTERVAAALHSVSSDDRGRWLVSGDGYAELGLTGVVDGRAESVIIDRVRIDEDGTHWLVDYKTSAHEGGDLDGFLHAERARYQQQLSRYAELYREWSGQPVRCALYYPLLGRLVDVDA